MIYLLNQLNYIFRSRSLELNKCFVNILENKKEQKEKKMVSYNRVMKNCSSSEWCWVLNETATFHHISVSIFLAD